MGVPLLSEKTNYGVLSVSVPDQINLLNVALCRIFEATRFRILLLAIRRRICPQTIRCFGKQIVTYL